MLFSLFSLSWGSCHLSCAWAPGTWWCLSRMSSWNEPWWQQTAQIYCYNVRPSEGWCCGIPLLYVGPYCIFQFEVKLCDSLVSHERNVAASVISQTTTTRAFNMWSILQIESLFDQLHSLGGERLGKLDVKREDEVSSLGGILGQRHSLSGHHFFVRRADKTNQRWENVNECRSNPENILL